MSAEHIYKIVFLNQGEIYELYARSVSQGGLFGFVQVEDLLFGEKSRVVVDPSEERLEREFKSVKRIHVPMHAVVRIDEVEKQGAGRIVSTGEGGTVTRFPPTIYTPGGGLKKP